MNESPPQKKIVPFMRQKKVL